MNIALSLRSEMLKTRRTASFYFTLIGAAIVPVVFVLNVLMDPDDMDSTRKDPLNGLFKLLAEMNGLAFFPWFIILICTLLPQIEYRNNTWKQVFASPQTKLNVFLAKFLNIQLLMVLFLVATHVFMFVAMFIANLIKPSLHIFDSSLNTTLVLTKAGNAYVSMLAMTSLQFWMGLRFRNFIIPIATGLTLWLMATVLMLEYHASFAPYLPYCFQIFYVYPKYHSQLPQVQWTSLGMSVFFLVLGFLDFRRRRMAS
jgi:lantibiotic transport system permease protein